MSGRVISVPFSQPWVTLLFLLEVFGNKLHTQHVYFPFTSLLFSHAVFDATISGYKYIYIYIYCRKIYTNRNIHEYITFSVLR